MKAPWIAPVEWFTGPLVLDLHYNYIKDERTGRTGSLLPPWPRTIHVEGMRVVVRDDAIHIEVATPEELEIIRQVPR